MRELIYKDSHSERFFGIVGAPTIFTYVDGSFMHVGDIVKISGNSELSVIVCDGVNKQDVFVMGLRGSYVTIGIVEDYAHLKITLVRKHYHTSESDYPIRSIHMKTIAEPKQPKSKLSQITVPVKVDVQPTKPKQSRPIIEDDGNEVYIYVGNTTIYIHPEFCQYGVSTCSSEDIYDKMVGKSVAYFRANHAHK